MSNIKVSIITVVRNGEKTIKDTIESVLSQTYSDIEYILIDGCSTDKTVEIINGYEKQISKQDSPDLTSSYCNNCLVKNNKSALGDYRLSNESRC